MWILYVFGFVLIVGTLLGLVWRFLEDWFEKRAAVRLAQAELAMEEELTQGLSETAVNVPVATVKTN